MIVGGRGRPAGGGTFREENPILRGRLYYNIILFGPTKAVCGRESRRRTTVTAVTFRSLGLTGGRGDLNRYTAEMCTATAVPLRRWGLRVGGGQIESLL